MADLATAWPDTVGFRAVNFRINTPTQLSETFSGKLRRVGLGISYYSWEAVYANLVPIDAGTVLGYVAQAQGPQFSFEILLPHVSFTNLPNQTSSTPRLSATAPQGSTSVSLTNCGSNGQVLAAGDFFKFNDHSKVYMCAAPCIADGSGNATLFFTSPTVQAVSSSTELTINTVRFTAVLEDTEQEYGVGFGGIVGEMSFNMREVW